MSTISNTDWQKVLYQELLRDSSSYLNANSRRITERQQWETVFLGVVYLNSKMLNKETLVSSDPRMPEIFNRCIYPAIQQTIQERIERREFVAKNPLYAGLNDFLACPRSPEIRNRMSGMSLDQRNAHRSLMIDFLEDRREAERELPLLRQLIANRWFLQIDTTSANHPNFSVESTHDQNMDKKNTEPRLMSST